MSTPAGPAPSPPAQEPQTSSEAARGLARKLVLAAIFGALVFAGLALYSDVEELHATARTFAISGFVIGLLLATGNYVLRIARWQYYLIRLGFRVPLGQSSVIFLAGFVMSVTPGKVGEVFKSLMLYEARGISIARTAPIVIAERLTDLIGLVLLTALGSLAFEQGVLIASVGAALVGALALACSYRPLGHFLLRIADRLPLLRKLSPKMHEAYEALLEMTRPTPLLVGTAVAVVAWGMECGSLYCIVHGFEGVHMSWDAATFAYSASTIVGALAMMPGGLGVTEAGMTGLLQALGGPAMTAPVATAATILVRIATLWFAVGIGLLALPLHRALKD